MAAFAPQTVPALNEENELAAPDSAATELFSMDHLSRRPLARIAAGQPLDLQTGVNPAWEKDVRAFRRLFRCDFVLGRKIVRSDKFRHHIRGL